MDDYFEELMEFVIDLELDDEELVCSDVQDDEYDIEEVAPLM